MLRSVPIRADDPAFQGLTTPGAHGTWREYLLRLWERRDYIRYVPFSELRSQQMNTVLGNLWHLFNPILSIGVYGLVFGMLLETNRGVEVNFVAFLGVGVFVFGFTQKAAVTGSQSMSTNKELLRSISFPRALLPITGVVTELFAFLPGILVMLVTTLLFGEPPRFTWLVLPALLLVQTVFSVGLALIAARAAASFGDVKNVLPFLFRLLFYGSGVLFSVDAYLEDGTAWHRWIFVLNPMYCLIELYRWAILGIDVTASLVVSIGVWSVVVLVVGLVWFRNAEATYGA
jgi:teichoic acid transport system permease protein